MNVNKRQRRSPEAARTLLLDTAEQRLAEMGLEGLNVAGVAKAAGMSHATLLHHFGNAAGMRAALVERMGERLVREAMAAIQGGGDVNAVVRDLFAVLTTGGHAKLMAWRAIEPDAAEEPSEERRNQFEALIRASTEQFSGADLQTMRNVVTLVIAAAIGLGVGGSQLFELLGLDDEAQKDFPDWLAGWVDRGFGDGEGDQ